MFYLVVEEPASFTREIIPTNQNFLLDPGRPNSRISQPSITTRVVDQIEPEKSSHLADILEYANHSSSAMDQDSLDDKDEDIVRPTHNLSMPTRNNLVVASDDDPVVSLVDRIHFKRNRHISIKQAQNTYRCGP